MKATYGISIKQDKVRLTLVGFDLKEYSKIYTFGQSFSSAICNRFVNLTTVQTVPDVFIDTEGTIGIQKVITVYVRKGVSEVLQVWDIAEYILNALKTSDLI
jgi:hypothetical protein